MFALEDIRRSAAHGIRSVLITDVGLLAAFQAMRDGGVLPREMQAKMSVAFPIANPSTARVLVGLGANTLNLVTDLSLAQIAAIRAAVDVPIDFYIESPDNLGGFVRLYELAELIRVAAPGLREVRSAERPEPLPVGHAPGGDRRRAEQRAGSSRAAGDGDARRSGRARRDVGAGALGLAVPVPAGSAIHRT